MTAAWPGDARSTGAVAAESSYASAMDDRAGAGAISPEDDEFTVSQDTEFDEEELAADDDDRPLDDSLVDEVPGLDAERRVDLRDERAPDAED